MNAAKVAADVRRSRRERAQAAQREYYSRTAASYDGLHVDHGDVEHRRALRWILHFARELGLSTLADVGAGTGRVGAFFRAAEPSLRVVGVEPVRELAIRARSASAPNGVAIGSGETLPFASESFDAVCEMGVLHHVPDPEPLVREMTRVARRAIFLSDANRFGQGSLAARLTKLVVYRAGLWPIVETVRSGLRGYRFSEGDGVFYSYSVYDSLPTLGRWADHVVLIPTAQSRGSSWLNPLLTTSHVLLCAFRGKGAEALERSLTNDEPVVDEVVG